MDDVNQTGLANGEVLRRTSAMAVMVPLCFNSCSQAERQLNLHKHFVGCMNAGLPRIGLP